MTSDVSMAQKRSVARNANAKTSTVHGNLMHMRQTHFNVLLHIRRLNMFVRKERDLSGKKGIHIIIIVITIFDRLLLYFISCTILS